MSDRWSECDVVIVGAGAAGLSAAKELTRLGVSHRLIEGAHRIGGRAYSEEIGPGEWFDLGCAWLVGAETNPFTSIARELGLALSQNSARFRLENARFNRNGELLSGAEREACLAYYGECEAAIADAAGAGRDVALSDVIDLDHEFATPFLAAIATGWGKDVDEVSTVDNESAVGELGYQVPQGYGNLVATWGNDVPVSLNSRAERIDWSEGTVNVATSQGAISATAALLTVSTGVLASQEIAFHPRLPDWKLEAIHDLPMGTENKIGVYFDTDVFGADGRAHYTTWDTDGNAAKVDASVMGLNTASVFVGGRLGVWLERQGPAALQDFAISRLVDIFGNDLRKRVQRCITTAWESDPWTRGTWACARPGRAYQRTNLARPVDERLFFAGEATDRGGQGTCHGAFHSGVRAAREIAATLKPARAAGYR